jgi:hypothetical protein
MMSMDRSNGYMPGKARAPIGDILFIIKRGNARLDVFHEDDNYRTFVEVGFSHGNSAWFKH